MKTNDKAKLILDQLLTERPAFHGREDAGTKDYSINTGVLKWITENLETAEATLETGCGYSTALFSALAKEHTAISPFPQEHQLIKKWLIEKNFDPSNIKFIAEFSQNAIYNLDNKPLDLVLIDGDHAFPAPMIDFYYSAEKIKKGGYLIIDDIQIITGEIMFKFLQCETERWKFITQSGKTVIFERITDSPVIEGIMWPHQPFCEKEFIIK